jgi:putative heme-binding domain-containing protein
MRTLSRTWLGVGAILVLGFNRNVAGQAGQEHAGQYALADIQQGSRLYAGQCTQCHGPNGDQVGGVDLRTNRFRNATSDDDLRKIVLNGIPGTSMPGRQLSNPEVGAIIAYVRNMRDFDTKTMPVGDDSRGRVVFEGAGRCLSCHRVNGKGSRIAPDLSDIGSTRAAAALHQALLTPSAVMMPINRPVRAVTRDGKAISGRRLNEDTFTVQLMDDREQLVSLIKADLRAYTILTESTMPSYAGTLTPADLADVVAYLSSLKGRRQ